MIDPEAVTVDLPPVSNSVAWSMVADIEHIFLNGLLMHYQNIAMPLSSAGNDVVKTLFPR